MSKTWKKLRGRGKGLEGYFLQVLGREEGELWHL